VVDYGHGAADPAEQRIKSIPFLFSEVTVGRSLAKKMPYVVMESVKEPIYEQHANQAISDGC
jgi:hypothetical protein